MWIERFIENTKAKIRETSFFPVIRFFYRVSLYYSRHEIGLHSASLSYFIMFSVFPLILFVVYAGSYFLALDIVRPTLDAYIQEVVPVGYENIQLIIDQTTSSRETVGVISGLSLLWSGSGVFSILQHTLSVIWECPPRPYWKRRGLATLVVIAVSIIFLTSLVISPVLDWVLDSALAPFRQLLLSAYEIGLVAVGMFVVYRLFPNRNIPWKPALAGAFISSSMVIATKEIFSWYLTFSIDRFGYVYGSLSWLLISLLWIYYSSVIFFLGAEIGAELEREKVFE